MRPIKLATKLAQLDFHASWVSDRHWNCAQCRNGPVCGEDNNRNPMDHLARAIVLALCGPINKEIYAQDIGFIAVFSGSLDTQYKEWISRL